MKEAMSLKFKVKIFFFRPDYVLKNKAFLHPFCINMYHDFTAIDYGLSEIVMSKNRSANETACCMILIFN